MNLGRAVGVGRNETKSRFRTSIQCPLDMLHQTLILSGFALCMFWLYGCARPTAGVEMNALETPQIMTPQNATVVIGPAATSLPLVQMKTRALAPHGEITIQNAESGVMLRVGENFLLNLGDRAWTVRVGDETIVRAEPVVGLVADQQGYFTALKAGKTKLYATSDPPRRHTDPPCMQPTLFLEIPVNVSP